MCAKCGERRCSQFLSIESDPRSIHLYHVLISTHSDEPEPTCEATENDDNFNE